ncbi:hypothetical protein Tco_1349017, partial [Tanacetum coccineum]
MGHGSSRSSQLRGTIGTTDVQVLIDKGVDKEVQYYVYTLHVFIPFLKRLNDKYIKKKKMKAAMQRRLWDPGIKIIFFKDHLEDKVVFKGVRSVTLVLQEDKRPKRPQREKSKP